MLIARFIIGLLFMLGAWLCFSQGTAWYAFAGVVLVAIGLIFWGLTETASDFVDIIDD